MGRPFATRCLGLWDEHAIRPPSGDWQSALHLQLIVRRIGFIRWPGALNNKMTILEKLRRLRRMDMPEIQFRARRALRSKKEQLLLAWDTQFFERTPWWQAWNPQRCADRELCAAFKTSYSGRASGLLPRYLMDRTSPVFYWDLHERDRIAQRFRDIFSSRTAEILQGGDAIINHQFRIFGYPAFSCGPKISWRRDPIHGVESELKHFASLSPLDLQDVGDSKNVWEISRHQHFFTLCQAYLLSGDERYAEECLQQWEDWMAENPYLRGINWASSLEVAFRSWSWVWMIYFLLGSRALTGDRIGRIGHALGRNAKFISGNLSRYFAPNTHLLGEAFALFVIGLLFPELHSAADWHKHGQRVLEEEMRKQVRNDGSHFEQSTFYHRYATEFFLCAAVLADRNGCPFSESYVQRLQKMLEFLLYTAKPSGSHPSIGDSDGGRLLPFGPFDAEDHRPILSTGAVYFEKPEFRKRLDAIDEQTIWVLGTRAIAKFEDLSPTSPLRTSRTFSDVGLVTMRSDWTEQAKLMIFDAGPQGPVHAGHGHADGLSFICSANGVDWLVDPGTYVYSASQPWRDYFRSTAGHNTMAIDGVDQATPTDWFKWQDLPPVHLEKSLSQGRLDYAVGSHAGYTRLPEPVHHRRRILFVKPDYWLVSDELTGVGSHQVAAFFHFAPGVSVSLLPNGCLATEQNERFLLLSLAPGMQFRQVSEEELPIQGWYSKDYGHRQPATVLLGEIQTNVPRQFHWLLWPIKGDPKFQELSNDGHIFTVRSEMQTDHIIVESPTLVDTGGEISSSATLAVLRRLTSGQIVRLDLLDGSSVWSQGQPVLAADHFFESFSANWHADTLAIEAHPLLPFQLRSPSVSEVRINGERSDLTVRNDVVEFFGEAA